MQEIQSLNPIKVKSWIRNKELEVIKEKLKKREKKRCSWKSKKLGAFNLKPYNCEDMWGHLGAPSLKW